MSLNAWPSHKMELYDGWIIRFSYFYTHRTNSVEQFGTSHLTWREKIPHCEALYERLGSPVIFKISPLVSPDFDYMLENRGYSIEHSTDVMTLSLADIVPENDNYEAPPAGSLSDENMRAVSLSNQTVPAGSLSAQAMSESRRSSYSIEYSDSISPEWIEALFTLKGTTNAVHRAVVPSMYRAIMKETVSACIRVDGKIAATGLGILDRDYIGIYAIHVREDMRRKGIARMICCGLLSEGKRRGAANAYLQVVSDNEPARRLYGSLGFKKLYSYWFRVKRSPDHHSQRTEI